MKLYEMLQGWVSPILNEKEWKYRWRQTRYWVSYQKKIWFWTIPTTELLLRTLRLPPKQRLSLNYKRDQFIHLSWQNYLVKYPSPFFNKTRKKPRERNKMCGYVYMWVGIRGSVYVLCPTMRDSSQGRAYRRYRFQDHQHYMCLVFWSLPV